MTKNVIRELSLPLRERGLKLKAIDYRTSDVSSLPLRERGLKYLSNEAADPEQIVAPFAGAWIEIDYMEKTEGVTVSLPLRERGLKSVFVSAECPVCGSLPLRERGLKLQYHYCSWQYSRRSLCGSVD